MNSVQILSLNHIYTACTKLFVFQFTRAFQSTKRTNFKLTFYSAKVDRGNDGQRIKRKQADKRVLSCISSILVVRKFRRKFFFFLSILILATLWKLYYHPSEKFSIFSFYGKKKKDTKEVY